jgi:hypothetical protein
MKQDENIIGRVVLLNSEPMPKICPVCGNSFLTRRTGQKICSPECRKREQIKYKRSAYGENYKLSASTKGALSEMIVCSDLLKRGYYVFRSITPNSPYDVVAEKNGRTYRVEITTGRRGISGSLWYNKHNDRRDRFDVVAVWSPLENEITYTPELDELDFDK